jgi:4a-hydroxytetrahydrobiopterin dehydratase
LWAEPTPFSAAPTARSCGRGGGSLHGLLHLAQKGLLQLQSDGSLLAVRHPKMLGAAGDAMGLANEACLPCREGAPTLTEQEISKLLEELPGWEVVDHHHLRKAWHFTDFRSALDWVNRAGAICESQGHHAEFGLGWGHAEALIYTHKVDGLTRADAVLAARFEAMDAKNPYGAFVTDR